MIDDVKKAMEGLLEPKLVETDIESAASKSLYQRYKNCWCSSYVSKGKVTRKCHGAWPKRSNNYCRFPPQEV